MLCARSAKTNVLRPNLRLLLKFQSLWYKRTTLVNVISKGGGGQKYPKNLTMCFMDGPLSHLSLLEIFMKELFVLLLMHCFSTYHGNFKKKFCENILQRMQFFKLSYANFRVAYFIGENALIWLFHRSTVVLFDSCNSHGYLLLVL